MNQTAPLVRDAQEESQWLPRHLAGDRSAFRELMEAYKAPVYGFLVRSALPASARDDVFQEVFLRIHRAAHQYDPDRPLKHWLFTIVANTLRSHLAKNRDLEEVPESLPDPNPNSYQMVAADETQSWLNERIRELPETQQKVLQLHCYQQFPLPEVAQLLNVPLGTVKTHLRRGRQVLIRALTRRNGLCGGTP